MPQLKVCGITDATFAAEAAERGVDYLGLIFACGSPRLVTEERARQIVSTASSVPRTTGLRPKFVGVFVGQSTDEIIRTARSVPLDVVQLHGGYGADDVAALKAKGLEVWRLAEGDAASDFAGEDATLLDGRDGNRRGGTGKTSDWSLVPEIRRYGRRVVLAGGISSSNIAAAIATGADIIDVNSSIETAPGNKSLELLLDLLAAAKAAQA